MSDYPLSIRLDVGDDEVRSSSYTLRTKYLTSSQEREPPTYFSEEEQEYGEGDDSDEYEGMDEGVEDDEEEDEGEGGGEGK